MSEDLRNNGIAFLNNRPASDEATIIVVGAARSGTSMVGAALDSLGIHLGNKADKAVYEDLEISSVIEANDKDALKALIAQKNAAHQIWGFKRPEAFLQLPKILPLFRNPRIVMTFRDPVAIAKRNEVSMEMDFATTLAHAARRTSELVEFARKVDAPAMLVSYEKALANTASFIRTLIDFTGISASDEATERAASSVKNGPPIYLNSSRIWTEGYFEGIRNNIAHGWVRKMPMKAVCNVEIWADDMKVASGTADKPRADLDSTIGSHSFAIPIHNSGYRTFEAKIAGTNIVLKKTKTFAA